MRQRASLIGIFLLVPLVCALWPVARAEKLSFKSYTSSDGLAHDSISKIVRDSRGFLWFCTGDGLSRFNGYTFKNYTQEQGLPSRSVTDLLETKDGTYLIATGGGLVVFDPLGIAYRWNVIEGKLEQNSAEPPMFRTYALPDDPGNRGARAVFSLAQHPNGTIFAGSNHGLFRFVKNGAGGEFQKVEAEAIKDPTLVFNALMADSRGGMWIAANGGIFRMSVNERIDKINDFGGNSAFEDRDGRIWVDSGGHDLGIRIYTFPGDIPTLTTTLTKADGLLMNGFSRPIAQTDDGRLFILSRALLAEFLPGAEIGKSKFNYLNNELLMNGGIDSGGNLWFGTAGNGARKLALNGFVNFGEESGFPAEPISALILDQAGEVYTAGQSDKLYHLSDGKVETIHPFGLVGRTWGESYLDFQSADGEWWIPSRQGLLRFPVVKNARDLATTRPIKTYTIADGLLSNEVFHLFEDSRRDIWISSPRGGDSVQRWDRATGKFQTYTAADGINPINGGATTFGEDAAGNIWISFFYGGLVRYRNGQFRAFTAAEGIPEGFINAFLTDAKGRFWIATRNRGLFRVDQPNADTPAFANLSTAQGLLSNEANCLTTDKFGRIYIGTGRGLNRMDPETQSFKVYTRNDGLTNNYVSQCRTDRNGVLWLAAVDSVSRLVPTPDKPALPPPVFIDAVSVNGAPQRISELGQTLIEDLSLSPEQRQLQISFFALGFGSGETLRYQYKLNDQEWTSPNDQRTIALNLSAGTYKFLVRAVTAEGGFSEVPATVSFRIARPIWQRWWFLALAALLIGGAVFALDRYRVAKTRQVRTALVETERAGKQTRESETRYRTLAETASDAIITIDSNSQIVYINEAAEKIFGYAGAELVGRPLVSLMPERYRPMHEAGIARYLTSRKRGLSWSAVELQGQHKDGQEVPLELSFGEFEKDGQMFFTGIARDITERKRAEADLQRAREERIAELQRVRSRIATDLHDDIGSSLTQIAVYSELARQRESENGHAGEPLDMITNVAGELVDTMSDIVWAINPKKDHLQDLTQRMRRFAANVLSAKDIELEFRAPDIGHDIPLGANIRREVFLIFKETVNNIVKHSGAKNAAITFDLSEHFLELSFADDGIGFVRHGSAAENGPQDWKRFRGGNGLLNMEKRAADLGGGYSIDSLPGRGTTVILRIPFETAGKRL